MSWQAEAIIELVRIRYPDWDGFDHAPFVKEEVAPKRKMRDRWLKQVGQAEFSELLAQDRSAELLDRLIKIGRSSSLLFSSIPKRGDLKLLFHPALNSAEYLAELFALLHDDAPLDGRLARYCMALAQADLPNQWAWVTFCLFMSQPDVAMFVKPRAAKWFLQFMGAGYVNRPNPDTYAQINDLALQLKDDLAAYKPKDLIDVQSVIWIAFRESQQRTGNLDSRAQIELGHPPSTFEREPLVIAETADSVYMADAPQPTVTLTDVAATVAYPETQLTQWIDALHRKGQLILYGSPGTGKTFLAQELASYLVGSGDGFSEIVQFHANYAYEDFVQGIRPVPQNGQIVFERVSGQFMQFCERAALYQDTCVLIIDELNRANVARVFGELMLGLEYRGQAVALAGGGRLTVPNNVRVIGTMNTADRSLALVDFALRRRFAFVEIRPNYNLLRTYHENSDFPIEPLIQLLQKVNAHIEPAYQLGVSYFLDKALPHTLSSIWKMEIDPYLAEYFFDQPQTAAQFRWVAVKPMFINI